MGENKGHGNKSPNYPELDQQGAMANRAGNQQNQQDVGNQQSDIQQSGKQQSGGRQSGKQQDLNIQQDIGSQQSSRQQDVGNQQSGQRQNQQKGGQHASGGTPALDDLNADLDSKDKGDWQDKQR